MESMESNRQVMEDIVAIAVVLRNGKKGIDRRMRRGLELYHLGRPWFRDSEPRCLRGQS